MGLLTLANMGREESKDLGMVTGDWVGDWAGDGGGGRVGVFRRVQGQQGGRSYCAHNNTLRLVAWEGRGRAGELAAGGGGAEKSVLAG